MNMQWARTATEWGIVHMGQDIIMVEIFPLFMGEKSEEFVFGQTLIQHLLFSPIRG